MIFCFLYLQLFQKVMRLSYFFPGHLTSFPFWETMWFWAFWPTNMVFFTLQGHISCKSGLHISWATKKLVLTSRCMLWASGIGAGRLRILLILYWYKGKSLLLECHLLKRFSKSAIFCVEVPKPKKGGPGEICKSPLHNHCPHYLLPMTLCPHFKEIENVTTTLKTPSSNERNHWRWVCSFLPLHHLTLNIKKFCPLSIIFLPQRQEKTNWRIEQWLWRSTTARKRL